VTINPVGGMSSTNTVTFAAVGGTAVIDAGGAQYGLTVNGTCAYYQFVDLQVQNVTAYALNMAGGSSNRATWLTFTRCKFDAPASTSSNVRSALLDYPNDCTFNSCVFAGGGWSFYTQQINRCMFDGCEFDGKGQCAYLVAPFNSNDADNTWQNCTFHSCGPTGRGLYFNWSQYGNHFFHNTIVMNSSSEAVYMGSCCAWTRCQAWRNNIIVNLGSGPCAIYGYENNTFGGGPGLDYNDCDYNCYYHPSAGPTLQVANITATSLAYLNYSGNLTGWKAHFAKYKTDPNFVSQRLTPRPSLNDVFMDDNSIEIDPKLVNITTPPFDFHLQGGSPCIDAGTTRYIAHAQVTGHPLTYKVLTDYEGEARPATLVDIGADEVAVRIIGSGSGQIGTTITFTLLAPPDAGLPYQVGSSFGNGPIPIDTRQIPLSPDNLLALSVGGLVPSIFQGYLGVLDAKGTAAAQLNIPSITQLKGLRIYTAFLTLKASAPSGVSNISNAFLFTVQ